jgi:hypothetical protein
MSGAQFVGDEAVQAPGKDGDEGDLDEGDEMFLRALEDGVQPTVAARPCERPLNHPADSGRNEASTAAAGNGLDGDAESLADFRQPLAPVAEIPQRCPLEASVGEFAQNRDNAFRVMPICQRNIDPQGKPYLPTATWILTPLIFFWASLSGSHSASTTNWPTHKCPRTNRSRRRLGFFGALVAERVETNEERYQ